jgi:hypothetical protein
MTAALPGVCLTIWRQIPFQQWAGFHNLRYVLYREIYFMLNYGTIDLAAAVDKINAAGREIGKAAHELPYIVLADVKTPTSPAPGERRHATLKARTSRGNKPNPMEQRP